MKSQTKENIKTFFRTLLFCGIAYAVISHFYKPFLISGESMEPTFHNGQIVRIASQESYKTGDVVIAKPKGSKKLIKRVVGVPGDTLFVRKGNLYVNYRQFDDYVKINIEDPGILIKPVTLGKNEYFLMGDNRNNSLDSRELGPVKEKEILGKVKGHY